MGQYRTRVVLDRPGQRGYWYVWRARGGGGSTSKDGGGKAENVNEDRVGEERKGEEGYGARLGPRSQFRHSRAQKYIQRVYLRRKEHLLGHSGFGPVIPHASPHKRDR